MSGNFVHPGRRLRVLFDATHRAGDLVYCKGFYGVVQDNVAAGTYGTLILDGVWALPRVPATIGMGLTVSAPATEIATTLPITSGGGGGRIIGRTISTGNATVAKILLDHPNLS